MTSPTQRTIAVLKQLEGVRSAVVEHWNPFAAGGRGIRQDLFGFIDIISITPRATIGIQVTTGGAISARKKKIEADCADAAKDWLRGNRALLVVGWRKLGRFWAPRVIEGFQAERGTISWFEFRDEDMSPKEIFENVMLAGR